MNNRIGDKDRANPLGTKRGTRGKIPPERLTVVRELIAQCWTHARIYDTLAPRWDVSRNTVHRYIKRVYDDMAADSAESRETRRDRIRAAVEAHYMKCMDAGKFAAAGQALDRLARIDGCYTDKLEVSGPQGGALPVAVGVLDSIDLTKLSDDQLAKLQEVFGALGMGVATKPEGK